MKLLDRLSVRGCVMLFAAVAAIGATAQGLLALRVSAEAQDISLRLLDSVQLARAAGTLDMMHDALRSTTLRAQLAGPQATAALRQEVLDELDRFGGTMDEALRRLADSRAGGDLDEAVGAVTPLVQRYKLAARRLTEAVLTEGARAAELRTRFDADFEALEGALENVSGIVEARAVTQAQEREALERTTRVATPAALALTIGLILGFGLPFARGLRSRLGAEPAVLSHFASRIADGELHAPFVGTPPRAGSVAAAMIGMRDRLRQAVGTIRLGAGQVATGSEQIRVGNGDLAERTEEQASRLQQAAAGMSHMLGGVERTAAHARDAAALAAGAADVAQRGGDAVRRVVSTMSEIQDSSRRIAEILAVIDGIAFQTNILALNAAVEAARAGEQGRGFAVVAGEVRALAQRSANAAREIKSLIGGSVERVETGSHLVADAGTTMEELVAQVRQVSALIERISREAGTQSEEIALVSRSVTALDDATQRNAALVEQSAAAAASLEEQAQRLMQSVSAFRVDGPPAAHMPA